MFSTDKKLFMIIFAIMLIVLVFTNNGHRYSFDEDVVQKQAMYIVTGKPGPLYVQGNSTILYEYPMYFPHPGGPICQNFILCSNAFIGHSLTEVPFILFNENFHVITSNTVFWDSNDFDDPAYVYWRNSTNPDFTFLQLFYGPLFISLSIGIFFLICRSFDYSPKNSIILALLLGFTTLAWPYSKTSFSVVPSFFLILLAFLFFRKFQNNDSILNLTLCALCLGFGFLVRADMVLFIIPFLPFLLYSLRKRDGKIKKLFSFLIPTISSYVIFLIVNLFRFGTSPVSSLSTISGSLVPASPLHTLFVGIFGLFLSPGVGLFIFSPILVTMFFTFPDFYKRNKAECILFLSFLVLFVLFYGSNGGGWWHGLVAWGPRYLVIITPFLLLPLGASIEKRKSKILKISIISLGITGFFFNLIYMIQDVSWFVWGNAGLHTGLYGIEKNGIYNLNIHPATLWTFEFSQLTQSIINAFTHLQPDIFLLKVLDGSAFGVTLGLVLIVLFYLLLRSLRIQKITKKI